MSLYNQQAHELTPVFTPKKAAPNIMSSKRNCANDQDLGEADLNVFHESSIFSGCLPPEISASVICL
jgi:hypothetical protein